MWVIVALASLAVILVLVLSVPFDIAFQVSVPGRPRFRMKLLWLFGLVSKEITQKKKSEEKKEVVEKEPEPKEGKRRIRVIISKEITRKKKPEEKKKVVEKEPKPKEGKRRIRVIIGILRTEGLLRQFIVLLRDLLRSLKIRDLLADFRVGLGNPADTGLLFALIGPTTSWLSSSLSLQIKAQPSFADEATFEGYSRGAVRLRPIQLVIPFLRFVFSLATVRMVKKLVLTKWKRKK